MKEYTRATILSNKKISDSIYEMKLHVPQIARAAAPGQFVNLFTDRGEYILPRPISICEIRSEEIILIYQVIGKGTEVFSGLLSGQEIRVIGPLGNGFQIPKEAGNHILVGGGIGVPPLVELAKNLKGTITLFMGSRTQSNLAEKLTAMGITVHVATDDGSAGYHGNVIELMEKIAPTADYIYGCGPKIMLKSLWQWAHARNINPQVSMEERMACGIGACVGCTVKIKQGNDWQNLKVCKDGPVFFGNEVLWEDE